MRSQPDRLRLLEAAAVDALRRIRAEALARRDAYLVSWATFLLNDYARSRWSTLQPGDRIEELSLAGDSFVATSRTGALLSSALDRETVALSVQWDDGVHEVIVAETGRTVLRVLDDGGISGSLLGRTARRRLKSVRRLRAQLVAGMLRPGEKLIADVLAETTVCSLLDRTVDRGMAVVLHATTERVLWTGIDGSDRYQPRPLGEDGFVRAIDYGGFVDFVAGSVNEGPRGSLPGSGFGCIGLRATDAECLPPPTAAGLASLKELRIWADEVTGTDEDIRGIVMGDNALAGSEFFQLFHFPVWGPLAALLVGEASARNSRRIA